MFGSVLHHHMHHHCCPSPYSFGAMTMMPRMNFFMGMAMATAQMPIFSMPYYFGNPFINIPLINPGIGFLNFNNYSNPFGYNKLPNYNFTLPKPPTVNNFANNFVYNPIAVATTPSIFSQTNNKIQVSTSNLGNTQNTISYTSSSKLKPGLLKGNLVGKEAVITQLCEKYGVDLALVVSIIGQESGFGTSNLAQHNNFMGYRAAGDCGKSPKGFGYFSTPEKGLEVAIRNLSKYPERYPSVKKADMNNIDAIGKIYCEGNTYASAIKNLYNTTVRGYLA